MKFNVCYPDANEFDHVIKIKSLEEWNVEYVPLDKDIGYWVADNPFQNNGFEIYKKLIGTFPIQKKNNNLECVDPNPFATIHVPTWASKPIIKLIESFYVKHVNNFVSEAQFNEWGNVYQRDARPIDKFRIPHIDYESGIVGNLWFTDHPKDSSGTKLYRYKGKIIGLYYDFQIDSDHPLYRENLNRSNRLESWKNFSTEEASYWGFEEVGMAPSIYSKITMYSANVCHAPYVAEHIDFRWSHTFAFFHRSPRLGNIL